MRGGRCSQEARPQPQEASQAAESSQDECPLMSCSRKHLGSLSLCADLRVNKSVPMRSSAKLRQLYYGFRSNNFLVSLVPRCCYQVISMTAQYSSYGPVLPLAGKRAWEEHPVYKINQLKTPAHSIPPPPPRLNIFRSIPCYSV